MPESTIPLCCVVLSIGGLEILCHQPVPDGPALHLAVLRTHCHRPHVQVPSPQPPSSTATFVIPLPPYLFLSGYIVLSIYLLFFRLKKLISRAGICFFLSKFFFFYFLLCVSFWLDFNFPAFFFFLFVSVCVHAALFTFISPRLLVVALCCDSCRAQVWRSPSRAALDCR